MWHIQGILMTRSDVMVRCNKGKLINGHNIPIMGKIHHSKECGHYNFHGVNIITPKEQKYKGPWTTITSTQTVFPSKVIGKWGRIPKGAVGLRFKSSIWSVAGTIAGEPMGCQAVEDRMLREAPSSTIVQSILLVVIHMDIWKETLQWRQESVRLL